MIEINLLETKKPFRLPEILGVDFNLISFKMIIIFFILGHVPDFIFKPKWEKENQRLDSELSTRKKILRGLEAKTKGQEAFKAQIDEFVKQEQKLEERLNIVKKIIELKKNPMSIMLYMTKNIPEDVWLTEMSIIEDEIIIKGESKSYKSIGDFIENLRNSVFFDTSLYLKDSKTKENDKKVRTEFFEIKGKIKRFD